MHIKILDVGAEIRADGATLAQCNKDEIVELVRKQGYALLSGFAPTVPEYERFTAQFGSCADTRHVHYPESGAGLGFHAEDAYNPFRPDAIWFLCVNEGSDGGVPTGTVDGIELLAAMPPRWQAFCQENGLRFDRQWDAAVWQGADVVPGRAELSEGLSAIPGVTHAFGEDDSLYVSYRTGLVSRTADGRETFSNTLLQAVTDPDYYGMSLADGSPIPPELLTVVEDLALSLERNLGWHTGELGVVDNLRMMHRRSPYRQKDRDLRVRHCENFFGTELPDASTPLRSWVKSLIQGDVALPNRAGMPRTNFPLAS